MLQLQNSCFFIKQKKKNHQKKGKNHQKGPIFVILWENIINFALNKYKK